MRLGRVTPADLGRTPLAAGLVVAAAALAGTSLTACAPAAGPGGGAPPGASPGGSDAAPPAPAGGSVFRRRVDPFPVRDAAGERYAFPFLGGFNVPRPQWVDVDSDGDLDLVVQETTGELLFFERVETGSANRYAFRPDRFETLEVGEWFRFVDVDSDGDPDLLAEQPFSYVRLYLNRGEPGLPRFVLAADTLRDTDGRPIFSDRQNIPNAADMDCDGLLDLFIGRLVGTVTRYEATGEIGAENIPRFRHVTDDFEGIEIIGQQGMVPGAEARLDPPRRAAPASVARFGSRHGANTMALSDYDGDGDIDLFWGDFFESGLLLIENTASCPAFDLSGEPRRFPPDDPLETSGYNAPTFGDVDADGDPDLLVGVLGGAYNANTTTADNLYFLEQTAGGFELVTRRYLTQLDVGTESVPALVDLDGDGDLDLLVSNKLDPDSLTTSLIHRFTNEGGADGPAFRHDGTLDVAGAYHNSPAFGDLDGDGRPDLLLGTWRDELRLFRNEGEGGEARFVLVDSAFVTLTRGSNAKPALGDVDGDGDLDLFVGESSGALNFYRNEGSAAEPRFELVSDEFMELDVGRRSAPALVDVDGDGDLDLVVGREEPGLVLLRNEGNPDAPRWVEVGDGGPLPSAGRIPRSAVPAFADVDGDGDLDLVVGGLGGGIHYFERVAGPGTR